MLWRRRQPLTLSVVIDESDESGEMSWRRPQALRLTDANERSDEIGEMSWRAEKRRG